MLNSKSFPSGTKVKIKERMIVPSSSVWDDDKGRISASVKKALQKKFFDGDAKITAEVVYISKEATREKLRKEGKVKIRAREPSGATLIFTVEINNLNKI